ncbi:MAG: hypothetical protein ACRDWV_03370 [Acidimicrobiales bacterium]
MIPGRGQWTVEVEQKATTGLGPLVSALAQPDSKPPGPGVACAAYADLAVPLALEDRSGRLVQPVVPRDECGHIRTQFSEASQQLDWTTISSRLVHQNETEAEVLSGCGPAYKDLFYLYAAQLQPARTVGAIAGHPAKLSICVFRDDPTTIGPGAVGNFVTGGTVTGSTESAILTGISGMRASVGCSRSHPEFAVISGPGGQPNTLVELGGCDRVLRVSDVIDKAARTAREQDEIGQATPKAITLIKQVVPSAS